MVEIVRSVDYIRIARSSCGELWRSVWFVDYVCIYVCVRVERLMWDSKIDGGDGRPAK